MDTHYAFVSENQASGHTNSELLRTSNNEWRINIYGSPYTYAILNESSPFGTHNWHVRNDSCQYWDENNVRLSFNACNQSEFNCIDGTW